jgi:hypothetical protein
MVLSTEEMTARRFSFGRPGSMFSFVMHSREE